jgi:hypothetical protein
MDVRWQRRRRTYGQKSTKIATNLGSLFPNRSAWVGAAVAGFGLEVLDCPPQ